MDMWVPLKKTKKNKTKALDKLFTERMSDSREENFFLFLFYSLLSQIYGNLTVGFRRNKHEKCSTRRGLRVGTEITGFH